jgi:hypothetical protein
MKKTRIILLSLIVTMSYHASAQSEGQNLALSGGWGHVSGNNGLDGYSVGTEWWFVNRVSLAFDFDHVNDTNNLSIFALQANTGLITVKSHMENYLFGPRVFFHSKEVKLLHTLNPFAELQFGPSHLNVKVTQTGAPTQSSSDTATSWLLGGGGDVLLNQHWAARINLGLERTHLASAAQSRFRMGLAVVYAFHGRKHQ